MQQKWDSLDRLIATSNEEPKISEGYNQRLLSRVRDEKFPVRKNLVSALSLIAAGFLLITVYTTDIRYKMIDLQLQVRYELTSIENMIDINNNLFGE